MFTLNTRTYLWEPRSAWKLSFPVQPTQLGTFKPSLYQIQGQIHVYFKYKDGYVFISNTRTDTKRKRVREGESERLVSLCQIDRHT